MAEHAPWVMGFPLAAMAKHGLIEPTRVRADQVQAVLRFFAVSTPEVWRQQWLEPRASFRRSARYASKAQALSVWLRWGEDRAGELQPPAFDFERVRGSIPSLRALTLLHPVAFRPRLNAILAEAGVVLLLHPELPGTRVMGATHWVGNNPVIQLSLRHKSDDHFWFALFHEIAHVLRNERRQIYLDIAGAPATDDDERAANALAREILIPEEAYRRFCADGVFSAGSVRAFAAAIGITPGIVVGRLQFDERIRPPQLSYLKQRFEWQGERKAR